MPNVWQIGISLALIGVTAWVNLHIRFAPAREAAIQGLKQDLKRVDIWLSVGGLNVAKIAFLIREVASSVSTPATRGTLNMIVLQGAALCMSLASCAIWATMVFAPAVWAGRRRDRLPKA